MENRSRRRRSARGSPRRPRFLGDVIAANRRSVLTNLAGGTLRRECRSADRGRRAPVRHASRGLGRLVPACTVDRVAADDTPEGRLGGEYSGGGRAARFTRAASIPISRLSLTRDRSRSWTRLSRKGLLRGDSASGDALDPATKRHLVRRSNRRGRECRNTTTG